MGLQETACHDRDNGYSLLEVMIAAMVVVVLAMGLAGSMGAAFLADAAARDTATATHACQQVMEELEELDYGDVLATDGNAILTGEGIAIKMSVSEAMVGMLVVEVCGCRPLEERTPLELAGMTMTQFKNVQPASGPQVRLVTYRAGR